MCGIQYIVENERKHNLKPRGVSKETCQCPIGGSSEIRTVDGFHLVTYSSGGNEEWTKATPDAEKRSYEKHGEAVRSWLLPRNF